MDGYEPASYGDHFADVYDDWYADVSDVEGTVATVLALAEGATILELGVGTGRLALPLAEAGGEVVGVDASAEMLHRLRAKPSGAGVRTLLADMADLPLAEGSVAVAFAAFNTFFNLTDPEQQARCLSAIARALQPGGAFVVEGFVPPPDGLHDRGLTIREQTDGLLVTASVHDADTQTIRGQHVELGAHPTRCRPWALHYRSPTQLDALLTPAGFVLESRHADWRGAPFTPDADTHVSVYRLTGSRGGQGASQAP